MTLMLTKTHTFAFIHTETHIHTHNHRDPLSNIVLLSYLCVMSVSDSSFYRFVNIVQSNQLAARFTINDLLTYELTLRHIIVLMAILQL